jgi:hypothetical protein
VPIPMTDNGPFKFFQQPAGCNHFFDTMLSFLKCPGGGIGRRTSFRY